MRTIMIALTIALAVCALPGCEGEDPVNGEVPACGEDPVVYITYPNPEPVNLLTYVVDFMWVNSTDCDIQAVRYLAMPIDEDQDVISELNEDPGSFGDLWSDWRAYDGPRGRSVRLESELRPQSADCCGLTNARHVFAVQARARDGSVTEIFEDGRNAMIFDCRYRLYGPRIRVAEINFLGDLRQYGPYSYYPYPGATPSFEMPGAMALRFSFEADSEFYGRKVAGIRYGWDIADLDAWDEPYADVSLTPEVEFADGEHLLTVEAIDDIGYRSSVTFRFDFIPMTMERDLLWVDDFPGSESPDPLRLMPMESEHDEFWEGLCSKSEGFDPAVDVYDVMENNVEPPPLELLAHYKNVVWTYSNAQGLCAWRKLLLRTNFDSPVNYLPMFMASGGHLWTLGRSDLSVSGLKGVLPDGALLPAHVGCPDYGGYCSFDPMPSRDYGVTAVDCVLGHFRTDGYMPYRSLERDAARYMYRDDSDPVALAHPGMPGQLDLSEEVTCPVCFWDPDERGFYYVEVYDPYYWMSIFAMMTSYIHPMYRMKSRNTLSPLNDQAVALWVTRYQDVVPAPAAGPAVAAPSAHMGFPLWFFDHDQAGQVADVIFGAWGIGQ